MGQLPKAIVIGMAEDDAFTGLCTKYGDTAICYQTLFYGLYKLEQESGSIIKREDWSRGYALLAFDLTPTFNHGDHYSLVDHGKVKLKLQFSNKHTHGINIMILCHIDNVIEIDKDRTILFDYS